MLFFSTGSRLLSSRYSQGVAGLFFSKASSLLPSRFSGSRWLYFSTVSRLLSSRDSQGVAGLSFSKGSKILSGRYSQGVAGYSSQRILDYCPVDIHRESLVILLNGY